MSASLAEMRRLYRLESMTRGQARTAPTDEQVEGSGIEVLERPVQLKWLAALLAVHDSKSIGKVWQRSEEDSGC